MAEKGKSNSRRYIFRNDGDGWKHVENNKPVHPFIKLDMDTVKELGRLRKQVEEAENEKGVE